MGLKLWTDACIELRWWWEGSPAGRSIVPRDRHAAGLYLGRLRSRPDLLAGLRRFFAAGSAGARAPLDDSDLIDQLATAIARGSVRIAETPAEVLWARDAEAADEALVERARPVPEQVTPPEEICWPCVRAVASARALREAAAQGTPFVLQG